MRCLAACAALAVCGCGSYLTEADVDEAFDVFAGTLEGRATAEDLDNLKDVLSGLSQIAEERAARERIDLAARFAGLIDTRLESVTRQVGGLVLDVGEVDTRLESVRTSLEGRPEDVPWPEILTTLSEDRRPAQPDTEGAPWREIVTTLSVLLGVGGGGYGYAQRRRRRRITRQFKSTERLKEQLTTDRADQDARLDEPPGEYRA